MAELPHLPVHARHRAKGGRPKEAFDQAATKMLAAIRHLEEVSLDRLLASWRLGRRSKDCPLGAERVFQFIGAIIYDMEWTSFEGEPEFENAATLADATNTISPGFALRYRCEHFVTHMLQVDYGFPATPFFKDWYWPSYVDDTIRSFERLCRFVSATTWRWSQDPGIPDQRSWDLLLDVLADSLCPLWTTEYYFTWDLAIMFYYYYSRRKPVNPQARREGWAGYTGVLQEIIDEDPTRGRERLRRKISLDIHLFKTFIGRPKAARADGFSGPGSGHPALLQDHAALPKSGPQDAGPGDIELARMGCLNVRICAAHKA